MMLILAGMAGTTMAQGSKQGKRAERKEKMSKRLDSIARKYNLTDVQKEQFKNAMKEHR